VRSTRTRRLESCRADQRNGERFLRGVELRIELEGFAQQLFGAQRVVAAAVV
jgi:hypothetical protein